MKIFGAGLSGLIAAVANPKAIVYEKNDEKFQGHHALLRFRTNAVSEITGIKFKKVRVIKAIWSEGKERRPTPRLVAQYSMKNTGAYENRSIMDVDTVERYIAPDNLLQRLIEESYERINFNYNLDKDDFIHHKLEKNPAIISTLPLSINARMLGYNFETKSKKSSIFVTKFKIANCDMYCTVYYPDTSTTVYRASITGNSLIIESKDKVKQSDIATVMTSMGLSYNGCDEILTNHSQPMGKLTGVNDDERRVMIYKMSHDHGVFSLGRFALHKNILLDDVAKDIRVIKAMMNDDSYGISTRDRV